MNNKKDIIWREKDCLARKKLLEAYYLGLLDAQCWIVARGVRDVGDLGIGLTGDRVKSLVKRLTCRAADKGCHVLVHTFKISIKGRERAVHDLFFYKDQKGLEKIRKIIKLQRLPKKTTATHRELGKLFGYSESEIEKFCSEH